MQFRFRSLNIVWN